MTSTSVEFVHPVLDEEVTAIGGHYVFIKEGRLNYSGREVLYFVGYAAIDTSCCGVGGCGYAIVPGFLVRYGSGSTAQGRRISLVEPIVDEAARRELQQRIKANELVNDVRFD